MRSGRKYAKVELIGMAFSNQRRFFDYTDEAIGKPTGIDIKEQKMTLPLIHVLNLYTKKIMVDQFY
jgi:octaprenyl-diphosphate synthase